MITNSKQRTVMLLTDAKKKSIQKHLYVLPPQLVLAHRMLEYKILCTLNVFCAQ